ncbi:GFA family protein [Ensifer sp.]|uniref:GFA family protein n=1 Tax=Ensifer sp. TaxID=1872086 RepID=UPI002E10AEB6|nr:GFA family protein [Ensifer sp.]
MARRTYRGGCHCGKLRYEATFDLDAGTTRCNCSFCARARYWGAQVQPEDFRLLSPEDQVGLYQFGAKVGNHRFCPACGIVSYSHGYVEELGGAYYSINIATLDDVDPSVLANVPVQYLDGRNDRWDETPAECRHL